MHDRFVRREATAEADVNPRLVGMQPGLTGDRVNDDRPQSRCRDIRDMMRSRPAAALDQSQHRLFAARAAMNASALAGVFVVLLAANVGFVRLHNFAVAAELADDPRLAHALADAVRHEPGRPVGAEAEHAPELVRRNAFL